jgi:hypothetical protein
VAPEPTLGALVAAGPVLATLAGATAAEAVVAEPAKPAAGTAGVVVEAELADEAAE